MHITKMPLGEPSKQEMPQKVEKDQNFLALGWFGLFWIWENLKLGLNFGTPPPSEKDIKA